MPYEELNKGRYSEPHRLYFVTSVLDNRDEALFRRFLLARYVVAEMRYLHQAGVVDSLAWVVMPDHLHWLLVLNDVQTLGQMMKGLKGRSARRINDVLGREGAVWQRAYYDHALRKEEDVKHVARYIVANPLRAGLVERLGDYPLWDAKWV